MTTALLCPNPNLRKKKWKKKAKKTPNGWTSGQKWGQSLMSKNYIKVTFEAWPCELRNSLLIAMQCNICKYCIVVTVICVKYAWHKDGAVLNIDMIQQTCVCSTSKICWFFNDLREIKLGDTSACQILCHLFQVICQQMHSHLKMP